VVLRLAEAFFAVSLWQRVVVMGKRKGKVRFVGPTAYGPGEWATRCNDLSYNRASCVRLPLHYEVANVLSLLHEWWCGERFRRMSLGLFSCLLSVVVLLLLLRTGNTMAVKVSAALLLLRPSVSFLKTMRTLRTGHRRPLSIHTHT
jgi:hypothetical protein